MNAARRLQEIEAQQTANLHLLQPPFPYPGAAKPVPPVRGIHDKGIRPIPFLVIHSTVQYQFRTTNTNKIDHLSGDWGRCQDLGSLGVPMNTQYIETPSIHSFKKEQRRASDKQDTGSQRMQLSIIKCQ